MPTDTQIRLPLPPRAKSHTDAHFGFCTADCYSTYNPANLSYAVVKNGAVQHHHTGPHAHEMAQAQAASIRTWATYMGNVVAVRIEEFRWTGSDYVRTATPDERV